MKAQNKVNRARLLDGCWFARPQGSQYFQRDWLHKKDVLPPDATTCVRAWDKGYSEPSDKNRYPDYTASIKMYKDTKGYYYIVGDYGNDVKDSLTGVYGRFRKRFGDRNNLMLQQAAHDGVDCSVVIPEESGAGKGEFEELVKLFSSDGFRVIGAKTDRNKLARFANFSAAAQNGMVYIIESSFNNVETLDAFYKELESFDGSRSTGLLKDDWVDACSDAYNALQKTIIYKAPPVMHIDSPTLYSQHMGSSHSYF